MSKFSDFLDLTQGSGVSLLDEIRLYIRQLNPIDSLRDEVFSTLVDIKGWIDFPDEIIDAQGSLFQKIVKIRAVDISDEAKKAWNLLANTLTVAGKKLSLTTDGLVSTVSARETVSGFSINLSDIGTINFGRWVSSQDDPAVDDYVTVNLLAGGEATLNSVLKGRMMVCELVSSIESMLSLYQVENAETWKIRASDILSNLKYVPATLVNNLKTGITSGLPGLYAALRAFINSMKNQLDDEDPSSNYFRSTDLTVRTYANGMVLTAISEVITAVGIVISTFSKVIGAIITVIGSLATVIGKTIAAATTDYEFTQFHFNNNVDSAHCFSFVVDQGFITNSGLAYLMRSMGYSSCSYLSKYCACVIFLFLKYPEVEDNNEIGFEVHLSSDFDMFDHLKLESVTDFNNTHDTTIPNDGSLPGNRFISINNTDGDKYALIGFPSIYPWDSNIFGYVLPFMWHESAYERLTPEELGEICYSPRTNSFGQAIYGFYSDEMQKWARRALGTAITIFTYSLVMPYYESTTTGIEFIGGHWTSYYWPSDSWLDAHYGRQFYYLFRAVYSVLQNTVVFSEGVAADMTLIDDIATGQFDYLITNISDCFNQIRLRKLIESDLVSDVSDRENYFFCLFYQNGSGAGSWTRGGAFWLLDRICSSEKLDNGSLNPYFFRDVGNDDFYSTAVPGWTNDLLLSMPTLTFNGWLAGIFNDALFMVGVAIAATAVAVGSFFLSNARAQAQSIMEGKWWDYHENYDESNTPQAREGNAKRWKEYKRARLKANILSVISGGAIQPVGMYDDSSSVNMATEEITSVISGWGSSGAVIDSETGEVLSPENSLELIRVLISGRQI